MSKMPELVETLTIETKSGDLIARGVLWHDGVVHLRLAFGDTYVSPMALTYPSLSVLSEKVDPYGAVIRLQVAASDSANKSV